MSMRMLVSLVGAGVGSMGDLMQCSWLPKGTGGQRLTLVEGAIEIISVVGCVIHRWSEVTSIPVTGIASLPLGIGGPGWTWREFSRRDMICAL
jgi:hypothetical protein